MSFALAHYGSAQYRTATVETVSPVQLVVKLYDGALRFLKQADEAIAQNDFAARGRALSKAHAIISELQSTLDEQHAPELCQELSRLYEFALHQITQCAMSGDAARLEAPMSVLRELRDAWSELAKQT